MMGSMSRRSAFVGVGKAGLALCGLSMLSCENNAVSLFIRQMQPPLVAGVMCIIPLDPNIGRVAEGIMDVGIRDDYLANPLLQSSLVQTANPTFGRVESNGAIIDGFVIELRDGSPEGPLVEVPFSVYQTSFVAPSLAGTPSFAATTVQVIPPGIGARLRNEVCVIDRQGVTADCPVPRVRERVKRIIVRMTAFGHTQGNISLETPTFDFPVNVCCGCTVQFPPDANAAETVYPGPDCNSGIPILGPATCAPGQDFLLDCRACAASDPDFCQPRGFQSRPGIGTMVTPLNCPIDR